MSAPDKDGKAEEIEAGTADDTIVHEPSDLEATNAQAGADKAAEAADRATKAVVTIEDMAFRMGWSPKDKWRGDPKKWKPADEFVEDTIDINGRLARDLKATKDTVDRISRTSAAIAEREIQKRTEELKAEFQTAVENKDAPAALKASAELARTQNAAASEPAASVTDFVKRNPWFQEDPEARHLALITAQMYADQGKSADFQFQKAEEKVRERFPKLFGEASTDRAEGATTQRKGAPAVNSPSSRTGNDRSSAKKGVADLPPEAKRAMKDFVQRGRMTEEEYAEMYWKESA